MSRTRRHVVLAATFAALVVGLQSGCASGATRTKALGTTTIRVPASDDNLAIHDLQNRVSTLERENDWIILPMTLLIGVLALGGAIGVVFSIRDQRRVSQLHELAVGSDVSAQLRAEQSFSAFLEGSQKTLNLVNDTLQLAKEATESESRRTEQKANSALSAIEEDAEELILGIDEAGDFEELVDTPENRSELRRIAGDLAALEGYVRLQDVELQPYSRFIEGMDRYLTNDTSAALHVIRHATQEDTKRQLQRMARYWAARLNIALGNYTNASHMLELAKADAAPSSVQWLEYERLRLETEFFEIARDTSLAATGHQRFAAAQPVLKQLAAAAKALNVATEHDDDLHPRHEMAVAQANVYMWIAYSRNGFVRPFSDAAIEASHAGTDPPPGGASQDAVRAWAVGRAADIYPSQDELHLEQQVDFSVRFGRAECAFLLGQPTGDEYTLLESHAIEEQHEAHREHSHAIELAQIDLICSARLLYKAGGDEPHARAAVMNAYRRVRQTVGTAPDHAVRQFSFLSRHNMLQSEFADEAVALKANALGEQITRGGVVSEASE